MEYTVLAIVCIVAVKFLMDFIFKKKTPFRRTKLYPKDKLPQKSIAILEKYVPFYKRLQQTDKLNFQTRAAEFINTTKIKGVGCKVEELDRMLLAAGALIPIFNFPNWKYYNLKEITVYPDSFNKQFKIGKHDSQILGMVGHGFMTDRMLISKRALRHGFNVDNDRNNTAIHEFIHLIDMMDGKVDGVPEVLMQQNNAMPWIILMDQTIMRVVKEKSNLKKYGSTSRREFFACISEYYFEQP